MQGRFDYNDIHSNKLAGVWIKNYASPVFRKNKVHHGKDVGFFVFQDGQVRERKKGRERESVWERYMEGERERERSCLIHFFFFITPGSIGRERYP